jgi:hypothetical protein
MKNFVITILLLLSLSSCTYTFDNMHVDRGVALGVIIGTLVSLN